LFGSSVSCEEVEMGEDDGPEATAVAVDVPLWGDDLLGFAQHFTQDGILRLPWGIERRDADHWARVLAFGQAACALVLRAFFEVLAPGRFQLVVERLPMPERS
jgi:hypothetical protein